MSNKNLGIILLSSVLTVGTAPFAFSRARQDTTPQTNMDTQRQAGSASAKTQKGMTATQDQIKKAQQALKDQGMYDGAVDGKMNSQFQQALRDYQTKNQLQSTGKLDHQTMSKLGIMKGTTGSKSGTGTGTGTSKGKQGQLQSKDEVRQVQTALQEKGIEPGPIDGIMGPKTKKAVADFQRQQNLYASGMLDPQTKSALGVGGMESEQPGREKPSLTPVPDLNPNPSVPEEPEQQKPDQQKDQVRPDIGERSSEKPNADVGMTGSVEDVRQAQMALKNRGFDPGEINGMLSSETQDAVRKFQSANNLPVTGNLDNRTQAALGISVNGTNPDSYHNDSSAPADIDRSKPQPEGPSADSPAAPRKSLNTDANKPGKIEREYHDRAVKSAEVLNTLTSSSETQIPESLLRRAEAIAVIPGMIKGAFGIGGRFGKGMVAARTQDGRWGAPVYISIGGGSFGAQFGLSETDLVLIFTDRDALNTFENGMSLKLGVDAGVTAGPVGRTAEAGVSPNLQGGIFAYSRSKGLFAGIALDGAVLDIDKDANRHVYGDNVDDVAIMNSTAMASNVNVQPFHEALERVVPGRPTRR
jgi:lipid-binding SYLF domain-containing protein